MATHVFLHIGLPKTGTSFLQHTLRDNEASLRAQGVLLPGRRGDHFRAYLDVCGPTVLQELRADPVRVRGTWMRLVDEARAWPATVLFTNELFSVASERSIARIVEDLSPAEVHVIVAVRDLARALPAVWQQSVKGGRATMPFSDYVSSVQDGRQVRDRFSRVLFPDRLLALWQEQVKPERIHLVTVPPKGSHREVLWQRFSEVVGIETESCTLSTTVNESLGLAEAELMRRVNEHLVPRLPAREVSTWVRDELGNRLLAQREPTKAFAVPEAARPWVLDHSRAMTESLRASGYDVHGRLEDLVPTEESLLAAAPHQAPTAEELVEAAAETIAELVVRLRHERRRANALVRRLRRLRVRRRRRAPRSLVRRSLARIKRRAR